MTQGPSSSEKVCNDPCHKKHDSDLFVIFLSFNDLESYSSDFVDEIMEAAVLFTEQDAGCTSCHFRKFDDKISLYLGMQMLDESPDPEIFQHVLSLFSAEELAALQDHETSAEAKQDAAVKEEEKEDEAWLDDDSPPSEKPEEWTMTEAEEEEYEAS